jgi:predicted DNA-binding transcriptional regulator AlpA
MQHLDRSKYATAAQLRVRYGGRSQMWIYRRLKSDPDFPRPRKFGRLRFWLLSEIEDYERSRAQAAA